MALYKTHTPIAYLEHFGNEFMLKFDTVWDNVFLNSASSLKYIKSLGPTFDQLHQIQSKMPRKAVQLSYILRSA